MRMVFADQWSTFRRRRRYSSSGLVGEGCQQSDLLIRKRSALRSAHVDRADDSPVSKHRNGRVSTNTDRLELRRQCISGFGENSGNLNDLPGNDGATTRCVGIDLHRIAAAKGLCPARIGVRERGEMNQPTVKREQRPSGSVTESQCALENRIEHRLRVGR